MPFLYNSLIASSFWRIASSLSFRSNSVSLVNLPKAMSRSLLKSSSNLALCNNSASNVAVWSFMINFFKAGSFMLSKISLSRIYCKSSDLTFCWSNIVNNAFKPWFCSSSDKLSIKMKQVSWVSSSMISSLDCTTSPFNISWKDTLLYTTEFFKFTL